MEMSIAISCAIYPIGKRNWPTSRTGRAERRLPESVRTRQKFALNEINGHRSCTIVNMGIVALQLNRTLEFDPVTEQFINDEEANRLVDQPMRAPWTI